MLNRSLPAARAKAVAPASGSRYIVGLAPSLAQRVERYAKANDSSMSKAIAGGEHAVLRHKGPYSDLHVAYNWLYGTWLPQSGREVAAAPVFEEYLNNPRDTAPAELLTEICLPLRPIRPVREENR